MTAVRVATAADAPALAALNVDVQQLHHDGAPQWFKPPDVPVATDYFRAVLRVDSLRAFVAEVDSEPRGYALVRIRDLPETPLTYGARVLELDQISVDAAYRGRGLGRALIDAVLAFAKESGADRVHLTVWDFNSRARHVFEQAGFATIMSRMVSGAAPSADRDR